jgi:hypothetical protein
LLLCLRFCFVALPALLFFSLYLVSLDGHGDMGRPSETVVLRASSFERMLGFDRSDPMISVDFIVHHPSFVGHNLQRSWAVGLTSSDGPRLAVLSGAAKNWIISLSWASE